MLEKELLLTCSASGNIMVPTAKLLKAQPTKTKQHSDTTGVCNMTADWLGAAGRLVRQQPRAVCSAWSSSRAAWEREAAGDDVSVWHVSVTGAGENALALTQTHKDVNTLITWAAPFFLWRQTHGVLCTTGQTGHHRQRSARRLHQICKARLV